MLYQTDVGLEEISRIFKQVSDPEDHLSSHLEGLDLEGNEITGACFENAGFSSIYDCPLIFLNLSSNPLSTVGQAAIANIILKNKVLRQLSLNSCGFQLQSLIAISSTLLENSTLQLLYLVSINNFSSSQYFIRVFSYIYRIDHF